MKIKPYPTQKELKTILNYDEGTGLFTWKSRPREMFNSQRYCNSWNTKYAEKNAGYINNVGLPMIALCKNTFKASRLAYIYVHGDIADGQVDHINRNILDNRISNLRHVSRVENLRNKNVYKCNSSGVAGVTMHKRINKYQVYIRVNKKDIHLGYYTDLRKAAEARYEAEKRYCFTKMNPNSSAYQYLQEG
jgi:hypothetical protein